jgi:hypothetical protein
VLHFLARGYLERWPTRGIVTCLYGAIRRPVLPLRLTRARRTKLDRLSVYTPLGGTP